MLKHALDLVSDSEVETKKDHVKIQGTADKTEHKCKHHSTEHKSKSIKYLLLYKNKMNTE